MPAADRHLRRFAALVVLFGWLSGTAAANAPGEGWPWHAVGRVLVDGRGPCSGVLVAPTVVLTVGHCVADGLSWQPLATSRLEVVLDDSRHGIGAIRLAPASPYTAEGRVGDVRNDWALLELTDRPAIRPVPVAGTAALRRAAAAGEPLFKVGYTGQVRRRDVACTVLEMDTTGRAFVFRCPGGAGQGRSGSALLRRQRDGYAVVGLQSAGGRTAFTELGIGVAVPE